jgi:hypothetical protein
VTGSNAAVPAPLLGFGTEATARVEVVTVLAKVATIRVGVEMARVGVAAALAGVATARAGVARMRAGVTTVAGRTLEVEKTVVIGSNRAFS